MQDLLNSFMTDDPNMLPEIRARQDLGLSGACTLTCNDVEM